MIALVRKRGASPRESLTACNHVSYADSVLNTLVRINDR